MLSIIRPVSVVMTLIMLSACSSSGYRYSEYDNSVRYGRGDGESSEFRYSEPDEIDDGDYYIESADVDYAGDGLVQEEQNPSGEGSTNTDQGSGDYQFGLVDFVLLAFPFGRLFRAVGLARAGRGAAVATRAKTASSASSVTRGVAATSAGAIGMRAMGRRVYVIGKHHDTARFAGMWGPGYHRFAVPRHTWTIRKNDAFIRKIVESRSKVRVASPPRGSYVRNPNTYRPTTFGREINQLREAGYQWDGDFLVPQ